MTTTKKTTKTAKTAKTAKLTKAQIEEMKAERKKLAAEKRAKVRTLTTAKSDLIMDIADLARETTDGDELIAAIAPIRKKIGAIEVELAAFTLRRKIVRLPSGWDLEEGSTEASILGTSKAVRLVGSLRTDTGKFSIAAAVTDGDVIELASGVGLDKKSSIALANSAFRTAARMVKRIYGEEVLVS